MAQTINTNVASLNAQRNLTSSQGSLATSLQRLSSGLRINSAKDDAAGLAISERFTTQIRGLNQATRNANDGISLAQTAEGDLVQISNNLQRVRELAVQSANATNSQSDRLALQKEATALIDEIDRIANQSSFNGQKLLNGAFTNKTFQVGANVAETITVGTINSAKATDLGGYKATGSEVGTTALGTGQLTIKVGSEGQTISVGASTAGAGQGQTADSAWAKAQAINNASAGVTAYAETEVASGTITVPSGSDTTGTLELNGQNIAITLTDGSTQAEVQATVAKAINAVSSKTGVTAEADGTGVKLTAGDGRNITFKSADLGAADLGITGLTTTDVVERGSITIVSPEQAVEIAGTGVANMGLGTATFTLNAVADVDITTQEEASAAIAVLDGALQSINNSRADLGALQNRFSSVVSSLGAASENLSASRGRILDADFASETANLTRAQILQQAGTAMLAQANSLPQNVLSLLR